MDCIAFACLLACEISHFACLIQATPLSALPLVSIGSGKYSRDWVQCVAARTVAIVTSFPLPDCCLAHLLFNLKKSTLFIKTCSMIQCFGVQTVTKSYLLTNTLNSPSHGKHFRSAGTNCCR